MRSRYSRAMLKWQGVETGDQFITTERAAVPGGWLVRGWSARFGGFGMGLTFMPDPDHAWDGSSVKTPAAAAPPPKR